VPVPPRAPPASKTWERSWASSRAKLRAVPTWPPWAPRSKTSSAPDRNRSMAGRIPDSFLDDLVVRSDIVEVIGARVPLKKAGREFKACCPFHNEKTPSFWVSPDKQFYHCFGCGAHGTVIGFLMQYEKMEFLEAVADLAQRAGLELPRGPRAVSARMGASVPVPVNGQTAPCALPDSMIDSATD